MNTDTAPKTCSEMVYSKSHWDSRGYECGRPIKRDGMCGLHAAATDRRAKNAARSDEVQTKGKEIAALMSSVFVIKVTRLGFNVDGSDESFVISRAAAHSWFESQVNGRCVVR